MLHVVHRILFCNSALFLFRLPWWLLFGTLMHHFSNLFGFGAPNLHSSGLLFFPENFIALHFQRSGVSHGSSPISALAKHFKGSLSIQSHTALQRVDLRVLRCRIFWMVVALFLLLHSAYTRVISRLASTQRPTTTLSTRCRRHCKNRWHINTVLFQAVRRPTDRAKKKGPKGVLFECVPTLKSI